MHFGWSRLQVGNDVVLRLEFIKEKQIKAVLIGVWIIEALAVVMLLTWLSLKLDKVLAHSLQCTPGVLHVCQHVHASCSLTMLECE